MRPRLLDLALVLTGGALYAAAFPPYGQDVAAWIALVPLLALLARASAGGAFLAGATYGAVFFTAIVPWVVEAGGGSGSCGRASGRACGASTRRHGRRQRAPRRSRSRKAICPRAGVGSAATPSAISSRT